MIGTSTSISTHGYPDQRLYRKHPFREVATLGKFLHKLIDTRPDVIGKLDFNNWFCPHGTHSRRRANDISFLDGSIKDTLITVFLRKRRGLAKNPTQSPANILSVKERFRMFF